MQVRPGIAVSAALHVILFVYLAYALAFHPVEKPKDDEHAIDMVAPPPPPPPGGCIATAGIGLTTNRASKTAVRITTYRMEQLLCGL